MEEQRLRVRVAAQRDHLADEDEMIAGLVRVGEPLRIYVVNAGPNRFSAFHVVGAIFDRVYLDGSLAHPLEGVQTVTVPVGGGAIFETRLVEAGTYPFVSHAFADATKGAVGMFRAQ